MARLREVVFDCERPAALARFWASALDGHTIRPYDAVEVARLAALGRTPETDPVVIVDGPGPLLVFQETREREAATGCVHLDLVAEDRPREVARLCALGASVVREAKDYTVMRDPEGNRFCVAEPR